MKITAILLTVLAVAVGGLALAQSGKEPNATKAPITAFVNVNVVPMDRERVVESQIVPTMALWETLIGYTDLNTLAAMPELK